VDLNKRVARLPMDAKERFKKIRAEQQAKVESARAEARAAYEKFLTDFGPPPRPDYRAERKVVASFIFGLSERGAGLATDGMSLRVNGREVAKRSSDIGDRFIEVCPGTFGSDKTSRRAANAALDILGAGVRVDDHGERAFLHPSRKNGGRGVVSPNACYSVEMNRKIRARAADALMTEELIGQSSFIKPKKAKTKSESQAELLARLRAKYGRGDIREAVSERAGDVAGLRSRRHHKRRR
jgi:hypothetical protein